MWKKSRNVIIRYTRIGSSSHLDDEVTYQPLDKSKSKIKSVRGVDKPNLSVSGSTSMSTPADTDTAAGGEELASLGYTWRGRGFLAIASSKWEILGYGNEDAATPDAPGNSWVVTYFAKTLFTPAGVDIYSRRGQLRAETVEDIKKALKGLGGDVEKLAASVFEVAWDGERETEQ